LLIESPGLKLAGQACVKRLLVRVKKKPRTARLWSACIFAKELRGGYRTSAPTG
jgi:hypothetical protein